MLGGEISVKSEPEEGSVFTVDIPVHPIDDLKSTSQELIKVERAKPAVIAANKPNETNKRTVVLIVEDNEDFRFYLKDNLKEQYQILEAVDGKDGWQKALSGHPQLIVSDISMPNMNGIELSKKIKADKRTSHIPVILLTALVGEEDQIKGLDSGANDYLTKPYNFEILNAKIKNTLVLNRTLKDAYSKQIQILPDNVEIESADAKLIKTIVTYIETNLDNPDLSVEHLSKHVGMSRGSLYRKILELTGLSPIEYIRAIKLDKAAVLLEKTNFNIAQVSYMIGFDTPNYFARMFKDRFQMTPSQYINLKRKSAKGRFEIDRSEKADISGSDSEN
jgi:DNA-binding response OmpR family regulator